MSHLQYMPGDQRLVDQLVYELKSKGIFDQFRKDCIADVDTRPAYQNLRQRVESSVTTFLSRQKWRPDLNKNQLREMLRKHILDGNYLEQGVERIVDQVVNPKVASVFIPQVEDLFYNYLGIKRKKSIVQPETSNGKFDNNDLLPTDLEAVSPGSVKSNDDNDKPEPMETNEEFKEENKMEVTESMADKYVKEENTAPEAKEEKDKETETSLLSDMTLQDSNSLDNSIIPLPAEIKPEDIPPPVISPPKFELEKIELPKDAEIPLPEIPLPKTEDIPLPEKIEKENYFKPISDDDDDDDDDSSSDSSLRRNMSPLTPIRNFDDDSCDAQFEIDNEMKDVDKKHDYSYVVEQKSTDNSRDIKVTEKKDTEQSSLSYQFESQVNINSFNTPMYDDSSNSNNLQIDYESDANSKNPLDKAQEQDQSSMETKKEKVEEKKSSHRSSHHSRDSHRHSSSSKDRRSDSKHSSSRDKRDSKSDKKSSRDDHSSNKSKSSHRERSRDRSDKKDSRDSSRHRHSSSHKSSSSSKDSRSHKSSSSQRHSSSRHSDEKKPSSSSSSHRDKSDKSSSRDHKSSKDSKSSSSHRSDKDRKASSSSRSKDDKDKEKKEKKDTDDHYNLSGRGNNNNRRSTDRDSNDGNSSSSKGSNNHTSSRSETKREKTSSSKSENTSSSSNTTSPSDKEKVPSDKLKSEDDLHQNKRIVRVEDHLETPMSQRPRFMPEVILKKPKFASNLEEAKKLMKMRKIIDEEQRRMNQEAALLLEFQANVRPSLSQVYSSIPGPELEFACVTHTPEIPNVDDAMTPDEIYGQSSTIDENKEMISDETKFDTADITVIENHDEITEEKEDLKEISHEESKSRTEYFEVTIIAEEVSESDENEPEAKVTKTEHDVNNTDLPYFSEQEKYDAEFEKDIFTKFFKSYSESYSSNKLYLINCDTHQENIFKNASKDIGHFEIVTYHRNGHTKLPKTNKDLDIYNNEVVLPSDTKLFVDDPSSDERDSLLFSPNKSECSFELQSDYDTKIEQMANTTSRQQIMEIILGGGIIDGSPSKMPRIDICDELNIVTCDNPLKRKFSDDDINDNNNRQIFSPNKIRRASESDQITSTTDEHEEISTNHKTTNVVRSKYLGRARRVGLPRPKRNNQPNSPSSDKSVENYEETAIGAVNGRTNKTPRNKVQRYDTSDLYKPKLPFLSRRNNIT